MMHLPPHDGSSVGDPGHLTVERIVELVHGELPTDAETEHLAFCRNCTAVYAELTRAQVDHVNGREDAPQDLREAGRAFVKRELGPSERPAAGGRIRVVIPALAVAALLIVMLWPRSPVSYPDGSALFEPIREELVESSAFGMVHPLVAGASEFSAPVRRGDSEGRPERGQQIVDAWPAERSLSEEIVLIAMFQATSDVHSTRAYLDEALRKHPENVTLRMMQALQDYADGDLDAAESALRSLLEEDKGDDLARLNLAILLNARGDESSLGEARSLAREVVDHRGDDGLARRARSLLQ